MATAVKNESIEKLLKEFKPGQKKPTPPPASGTRVFYESLYKQRKGSLMALQWCLTYGVLPREECEAGLVELERLKKLKKSGNGKIENNSTTVATSTSPDKSQSKAEKKAEKKKKKEKSHRKRAEYDDGGDFNEGIGMQNL